MPSQLMLVAAFLPVLVTTWASTQSLAPNPDAKGAPDLRYLLVHRGGSPAKNYYELLQSPVFLEPQRYNEEILRQYKPSPRSYGFDVSGYGIYQAWKVRIIATSDSQKTPRSAKDAVYVLLYPRNPDWKFCATKYSIVSGQDGTRKLTYTDFQDGREYTLQLNTSWPRPWQVYEIEILKSNVFVEIWQRSRNP